MATLRSRSAVTLLLLAAGSTLVLSAGQKNDKDNKSQDPRPKFTLKAQPPYGVAPARVVLTAELVGGADDFEEYYCPTIRWEWADDTSSESSADCAPYEAGTTSIKRRFTIEHSFKRAGSFKIYIRLKHHDKEVAAASTLVQVQPGAENSNP